MLHPLGEVSLHLGPPDFMPADPRRDNNWGVGTDYIFIPPPGRESLRMGQIVFFPLALCANCQKVFKALLMNCKFMELSGFAKSDPNTINLSEVVIAGWYLYYSLCSIGLSGVPVTQVNLSDVVIAGWYLYYSLCSIGLSGVPVTQVNLSEVVIAGWYLYYSFCSIDLSGVPVTQVNLSDVVIAGWYLYYSLCSIGLSGVPVTQVNLSDVVIAGWYLYYSFCSIDLSGVRVTQVVPIGNHGHQIPV